MCRGFYATFTLVFLVHASAWAAPKARLVNEAELASTTVQYEVAGRTKSKVVYCLGKLGGDSKNKPTGVLFTPFSATVAKLKARRISGSKLSGVIALNKAAKSACVNLGPGPGATPTPAPGSTSNFDSSGNLTAQGKIAFGVPSAVNGNITTGRSLTLSYCSCHQERIGRSFGSLRSAIEQSPMFFDDSQITDAMLASITAYLNRFNF